MLVYISYGYEGYELSTDCSEYARELRTKWGSNPKNYVEIPVSLYNRWNDNHTSEDVEDDLAEYWDEGDET